MTPGAVLLMGPTASGKTGLSLDLAEALIRRGRQAEIVSVDSVQVYRGLDIGTAKPTLAERRGIVHHLIDICDPAEVYSAARFRDDATRLIAEIRARGAVPLLVGGTLLYFRALVHGLDELPSADAGLRAELGRQAERDGWPALHARLARLDPVTAGRLHPNDRQRIQRALEVVLTTGRPMSELHGTASAVPSAVPHLRLVLAPASRAALHDRISRRLDAMWGQGLVGEVEALFRRGGLHPDLPAIRAVGYRQVWQHFAAGTPLPQVQAQALAATRQFAKRQMTWLRVEHDPCWMNSDDAGNVDRTVSLVEGWLSGSPC